MGFHFIFFTRFKHCWHQNYDWSHWMCIEHIKDELIPISFYFRWSRQLCPNSDAGSWMQHCVAVFQSICIRWAAYKAEWTTHSNELDYTAEFVHLALFQIPTAWAARRSGRKLQGCASTSDGDGVALTSARGHHRPSRPRFGWVGWRRRLPRMQLLALARSCSTCTTCLHRSRMQMYLFVFVVVLAREATLIFLPFLNSGVQRFDRYFVQLWLWL